MPERGWRRWVCRHWRCKPRRDEVKQIVVCARCGVLLGGPLTFPLTVAEAKAAGWSRPGEAR